MFKNGLGSRAGYTVATLLVIAAGLLLRRFGYPFGLPFIIVNYGAAALWGGMVFLILSLLFAPRVRPLNLAVLAVVLSAAVEFFRLYHTPWLDAFRLTLTGALLIGRIFSIWNIVSYTLGIAAAYFIDAKLARATG
jgi:hypothetical protein